MNSAAIEYDGQNKYIRITDIDENSHQYIDSEPVSPDGNLEEKYIVKNNDILFARTGASVGKTYLYNAKDGLLYFAGFLIRVNIKKPNNSYFIFNQTLTERYKKWVLNTSMRSGQPGINSQEYGEYNIYYPSVLEQNKIAEFLSLVDKRIDKQRQLVENLKKYKRGLLSAIFERKIQFSNNEIWLEKKLKEVCNGFDNQRKPISAELREKGQIPYYGANGIQDYVKDYIFDGEYVLLAEDGGHFDEFSTMPIAQFINGKAWVNNHAHILQGKDTYNTKFIYYALVHKDIRKYINGTSRAKLNQEDMWDIQIIVPSFKLQIEIVEYFSKFDKIIKIHENCLKNLEYLKKGFLQQMFI